MPDKPGGHSQEFLFRPTAAAPNANFALSRATRPPFSIARAQGEMRAIVGGARPFEQVLGEVSDGTFDL